MCLFVGQQGAQKGKLVATLRLHGELDGLMTLV